jgi:hypothetical protein
MGKSKKSIGASNVKYAEQFNAIGRNNKTT